MFKITKTTIYSNKIDNDIKMLIFSDIHYSGINDNNKLISLLKKVYEYDVEYICICGDLIDYDYVDDKDYFVNWLKKLSYKSKVILSLGNHDIRTGSDGKYKKFFNKELYAKINKIDNVYLLDNSCKTFNNIYFYGYTQSFNYYYEYKNENLGLMKDEIIKNKIDNVSSDKFNILLMHSPVYVLDEYIKNKFSKYNLIICGHMHNGLVPPLIDELFKNNVGIISPNKDLFPKNARGIIKKDNTIVLSSGVTKLSRNVPIFIRWLNFIFPIGLNYITIKKKSS